jgi:hypothetical protein
MTDVFDTLLNSTCDVLIKGVGTADDYGQPVADLTRVVSGVACRLSTLKGGREWEAGKKYAENDYVVFMRPIKQDDAHQPFQLTARHWLKVYCQDGTNVLLNLKVVNDISGFGHHLEARGTEIVP